MAYKGAIEDIRTALAGGTPERLPVFALSQEFDARFCGLTYAEYIRDGKSIAKCQSEVIRRFDYDWSWLHVDDTLEFEALGVGIFGGENVVPGTVGYLPATRETLESLRIPDPRKDARMPILLDAITEVRSEFGDTICVTGRNAAPWSSMTLTYGMGEGLLLPYTDPQLLRDTLDFFADLQIRWGLAQIEAGAHAIWYGDCNASSHLISKEHFVEYALEPAKKVAQEYIKAGAFVFFHASEEDEEYLNIMKGLGVSALSIGPGVDIAKVRSALGPKTCILGNLDPIEVLMKGSPEVVAADARRIIREVGGPAYVFNTGECVPRETPVENMDAMISAAREAWASL